MSFKNMKSSSPNPHFRSQSFSPNPHFRSQYCCWPCAFIVLLGVFIPCVFGGALILGFSGVPNLRRYLQEERHLVPTTCDVISGNQTGSVKCSYEYNCGDHTCQYRDNEYSCLSIRVEYLGVNGTRVEAALFRSFSDAQKTGFRCSAYECKNPDEVFNFRNKISKMADFRCWYRANRPEVTYMDTTDSDELAVIVFTMLVGVLLIGVPVTILITAFVYFYCCKREVEVAQWVESGTSPAEGQEQKDTSTVVAESKPSEVAEKPNL